MKWVCSVCGYVYEGEQPPVKCPQCGVPASKFVAQKDEERVWAAEHVVGVAKVRLFSYRFIRFSRASRAHLMMAG